MKAAGAVAAAIALAVMVSGCYILRTLTYSENSVKPGKKTTARITLSAAGGGTDKAYEFFIMSSEVELNTKLVRGRWDSKGVFDGPLAMSPDPVLANVIVTNDKCPNFVGTTYPDEVTLVRTQKQAELHASRRFVDARLKLKVDPAAQHKSVENYGIAVGEWVDDGDGIPEPMADGFSCNGGSTSTINVK